VTKLGRGVDELEVDDLGGRAVLEGKERLAEGDHALLGANAATLLLLNCLFLRKVFQKIVFFFFNLDEDKVFVDNTIVGEATKGGDRLLSDVKLGAGVVEDQLALGVLVDALADAVDLLVDLRAVEVAALTSTGNRAGNTGRMPGTDTSDLAQTLVRLAGKLAGTPTGSDTLETLTLCDTDDIDHVVLVVVI